MIDPTSNNRRPTIISQKLRESILSTLPDWLEGMTEDCLNAYVEAEAARIAIDEHPKRFFSFRNQKLDIVETIDLKTTKINLKNNLRSHFASEKDGKLAAQLQEEFVLLSRDYDLKKETCNKIINSRINSKEGKEGRIIGSHTEKLITLFSKFNPVEEIIKIMKADTGVVLGMQELTRFYNANKTVIEKRKDEYIKSSGTYRIANEAGRLEIMNTLLTDLLIGYNKAIKEEKPSIAAIYSKDIKNLLEQARKEVKGNDIKLTVDGKIDITATIHGVENIGKVMQHIPINAIVVGLVAAKARLNPLVLVNQLSTSYYSNFNGFNKNILGRGEIQLPGELVRTYDWTELEEKNEKFIGEMSTVEDATYTTEEITEDERKRAKIMERIKYLKFHSETL